jgi:hypothetical protein
MGGLTMNSFDIGHDAEKEVANKLGGKLVPGSGNMKFISLDVSDKSRLVVSVKATKTIRDTALRAIRKLWIEAVHGTRGSAGHGDGAKPALAFKLDGELLLLIRLEDYADLATGRVQPYLEPGKAEIRRDQSRRSLLG